MSTVKRVAPEKEPWVSDLWPWYEQCLQDLAAGRHAKKCKCWRERNIHFLPSLTIPNACTEIVRCALEMRAYSVEVEP